MAATMKLLALLLLAGVAAAKVVRMPIHKQMPTYEQLVFRRLTGQFAPRKYGQTLDKGPQKLTSYFDNFYMANISIGSPPKEFQIIPDTGSSNVWVVGTECTSYLCDGLPNPSLGFGWHKNKYDHSKSSTSKKDGRPWRIEYGSGSAGGELVVDKVSFGGLSVDDLVFGSADHIADVFAYFPMDGIFGLGWPSIAEDDVVPPVQRVLGQLDEPLFTVWLDRHVKPSKGVNGGLITYGGLDKENCDANIVYVPLSAQTYWQFPLTGFAYGDHVVDRRQDAISDTGTSFIYGPSADVTAVVENSGAEYDASTGLYVVKCDDVAKLPPVVFKVDGHDLEVPAIEHVVDLELPGGKCALGFEIDFGFGFEWLIGDAFIRSYCQIYDVGQKRIGFAKAHHKDV